MAESKKGRGILVVGVAVVLIAVGVAGGVAGYVAGSTARTEARSGLSDMSAALALDLQSVLSAQLETSGAVASSPSVVAAAKAGAAGRQTSPAILAAQRELDRIKRDTADPLDALVLIGADGVCITATDASIVGKDLSAREYFQTVVHGTPSVGEVITSLSTGEQVVIAAAPVYDAGGSKVIGVLSIGSNLQELLAPLAAVDIARSGYAYVVNDSGVFLRSPDAGAVMTASIGKTAGMTAVSRAVAESRDAIVTYTHDGVTAYASVHPVPVARWAVIAAAPASELYGPANGTRNVIVLVSVIVAVAGAVAFFLIARRAA